MRGRQRSRPRGAEPAPVGLVVEGQAEYRALPALVRALGIRCADPIVFRGQHHPDSDLGKLAEERIIPKVRIAIRKPVRKVIVVLDRESREECAPTVASRIEAEVRRALERDGMSSLRPVVVVCADRGLENWLIADAEEAEKYGNLRRRPISPGVGSVDARDAARLLQDAYKPGRSYKKTRDAGDLASHIRVHDDVVRKRSRSLRKFLEEVER